MAVACVVAGVDRAFSNLLDPRLSLASTSRSSLKCSIPKIKTTWRFELCSINYKITSR